MCFRSASRRTSGPPGSNRTSTRPFCAPCRQTSRPFDTTTETGRSSSPSSSRCTTRCSFPSRSGACCSPATTAACRRRKCARSGTRSTWTSDLSRSVYDWVNAVCRAIGASEADQVPFEKYANAARGLTKPSSAARALLAGAPRIERADHLVQSIAAQKGMQSAVVDKGRAARQRLAFRQPQVRVTLAGDAPGAGDERPLAGPAPFPRGGDPRNSRGTPLRPSAGSRSPLPLRSPDSGPPPGSPPHLLIEQVDAPDHRSSGTHVPATPCGRDAAPDPEREVRARPTPTDHVLHRRTHVALRGRDRRGYSPTEKTFIFRARYKGGAMRSNRSRSTVATCGSWPRTTMASPTRPPRFAGRLSRHGARA